jgi:hypothetical protein
MAKVARFSSRTTLPRAAAAQVQVMGAQPGYLVHIDPQGCPFVDFQGNASGPIQAKFAVSDAELAGLMDATCDTEVLLLFQGGERSQPFIIGKIRDRVPTDGIEICFRGRRFVVETQEEVELRCGDAKLRITRDGKVVVLGNDLVSRARRGNRIKGGTVNIN